MYSLYICPIATISISLVCVGYGRADSPHIVAVVLFFVKVIQSPSQFPDLKAM